MRGSVSRKREREKERERGTDSEYIVLAAKYEIYKSDDDEAERKGRESRLSKELSQCKGTDSDTLSRT